MYKIIFLEIPKGRIKYKLIINKIHNIYTSSFGALKFYTPFLGVVFFLSILF